MSSAGTAGGRSFVRFPSTKEATNASDRMSLVSNTESSSLGAGDRGGARGLSELLRGECSTRERTAAANDVVAFVLLRGRASSSLHASVPALGGSRFSSSSSRPAVATLARPRPTRASTTFNLACSS